MNKDNESNTKTNGVKQIPEIILDKKAYSALISNKMVSFRKKLAARLDEIFSPGVGFKTWKSRFLYPQENIPAKNVEKYTTVMTEMLLWTLQEQVDYLNNQKNDIDKLIDESLQIINAYKHGKEE